jgi:hypothetical protein
VALAQGVTASAFSIIESQDRHAYWVIGHKDSRVVSIQLTGNHGHPDFSFSSIMLNDPKEKVSEILGPRHTVRRVPEVNGDVWDYYPFQISVEIVEGRVYSIRVGR